MWFLGGGQHLQDGEEATGRGQSPSAIRKGGGLGDGDHRGGETGQEVPSRTRIPQEAGTPPRLRRGGGRQRLAGTPQPASASPWKRWVGCLRQAPEAGPPSLGCGLDRSPRSEFRTEISSARRPGVVTPPSPRSPRPPADPRGTPPLRVLAFEFLGAVPLRSLSLPRSRVGGSQGGRAAGPGRSAACREGRRGGSSRRAPHLRAPSPRGRAGSQWVGGFPARRCAAIHALEGTGPLPGSCIFGRPAGAGGLGRVRLPARGEPHPFGVSPRIPAPLGPRWAVGCSRPCSEAGRVR